MQFMKLLRRYYSLSKKFFMLMIFCVFSTVVGFSIAYYIYQSNNTNLYSEHLDKKPINATTDESYKETPVSKTFEEKTILETKIVFEYLDNDGKVIDSSEEKISYSLIDMTKQQIQAYFSDWQLSSFSQNKIVLRKLVNLESDSGYILGEFGGYVAVFYKEEMNGTSIKEITDTPISSLNKTEQNNLKAGIYIKNEEQLVKALEDYGS